MTNRPRRAAGVVLALLLAAVAGCSLRGPAGTADSGGPGAADPSTPAPDLGGRRPPAPVAPAAPVPARLVAASPAGGGASSQCLAQIEAFAERHTGNRVMLGEAAFADSNQLVLTRMPRRGSDGRPLDGRAAMPQPVVLELLRDAGGCSVRVADAPDAAEPEPAGMGAARKNPVKADVAPLPGCRCVPIER